MQLKKKQYVPLHAHLAKGSIGDSILKIKDYIKKAKKYRLEHLSMTDHGSLNAVYDFYNECTINNINPIIGLETYEASKKLDPQEQIDERSYVHLVLLAKNNEGFKNLLYILTDANLEGFYRKPRTDINTLKERGKGIIALSACLAGKIPNILNKVDLSNPEYKKSEEYKKAIKYVEEYKECFDEFYLELQPGNFEQQIRINQLIVQLSQDTNTQLVITNDIHYLDKEDYITHDAHVKIARKEKLDTDMVYPDQCYYFMDYKTIKNSFPYLPSSLVESAIKQTNLIASKCNVRFDFNLSHMPKFKVPKGYTEESYLVELSFNKLEEIKETLKDPAEYSSRILREIDTISKLGFCGYFLVVKDFIDYAKANDIPVGPGRGSVCGSLIAFLIGITEVDPIKYNLLFERFLSEYRVGTIPDIDLDFCSIQRHKMFDYAVEKYGKSKCALVAAFGMRKAKASIKDTARIYNIDQELANTVSKLIPTVFYDDEGEKTTDLSIEESIEAIDELKEYYKKYPDWFNTAIKLEDIHRTASTHAAGTLISPVDLIEYVPLIRAKDKDILATSINLEDAEIARFVKLDFLGLATLAVIDQTEKEAKDYFDFKSDEFNEPLVWDLIGSKNTTGLFQISSKIYKERMHRLKPKTINELAACLALVRGPCISSKQDEIYMQIVEGKREIELIHPFYDQVTKDTNGILLYQEQCMNVCVNFGFDMETAFNIMKACSKKKMDKIFNYEKEFLKKAKERDVDDLTAKRIFNIIVDTGLYSFNQSHAVAYAMLTYKSAYYKFFYPLLFLKNCLTNAYIRKENTTETAEECRRIGLKFLPPDINKSTYEFSIEDGKIRIGFCAIKSFGEDAAAEIIKNRPFKDLKDVLDKTAKKSFSKRAIVPAIFAGVFSSFNESRLDVYKEFCNLRKETSLEIIKLQGSNETFFPDGDYKTMEELLLDYPFISNPANNFESINFNNLKNKSSFECMGLVKKVKKFKDKNEKMMASLHVETADGVLEAIMFANVYETYKSLCRKDTVFLMKGKKEDTDKCIITSGTKI